MNWEFKDILERAYLKHWEMKELNLNVHITAKTLDGEDQLDRIATKEISDLNGEDANIKIETTII